MIVMDRENLWARGWSHVLSTTNDIAELRAFCELVGAPPSALHLGNRRWPHLDLKLLPRERALARADVRVFERTCDMLRFVRSSLQGLDGFVTQPGSLTVTDRTPSVHEAYGRNRTPPR